MKKIMVIGCPGSGKSTFSRKLHTITGIPLFHLDMMYWNVDRTTVDKTVSRERLSKTIEKDEWIIDGNYGSTIELRLKECDTVIFLDYPLDSLSVDIETGETIKECCAREFAEETGYVVDVKDQFLTINEYYEEWHFASHYFICDSIGETERGAWFYGSAIWEN